MAVHMAAAPGQIVRPVVCETKLTNPHMGFIYYGGTACPDIADIYYTACLTWGALEPREGEYVWDLNHPEWATVKTALARGKRVGLRVMPSFQGYPYATPKWVHDLGVGRFPRSALNQQPEVRDLYEPEWWNPIYIEKYCRFVAAFGAEFDGKPWLDWVDMRCYGFWGEGHRFGAQVPWPSGVSKRETLIRFIDAHAKAFKKTPVVVQTASDEGEPYPQGTAIDHALMRGCWMRRDGFGPYINDEEADFIKSRWKTSLMIAENGESYSSFAQGKIKKWWIEGSKPISLEDCLDQMLELHCNYIPLGWGDTDWSVLDSRPELLKKLWMRMGYRLVIEEMEVPTQAVPGQKVAVRHVWRNAAVGRLPRAYPLAVYLIDSGGIPRRVLLDTTFDQTAWFDGERHIFTHSVTIPEELPSGVWTLAVALVDPATSEPAIALGIAGSRSDRIYELARITVTPKERH